MNETTVTIVGNAATAVRYCTTAGGVPLASFRLASTERRYDRARGAWVDGETSFYTVWAWRWMADNVMSSVSKGDPLVVTGRMRVRDREHEGKRHLSVEVDAWALGHDLARGTSAFRRVMRGRPGASEQAGGSGHDSAHRGRERISVGSGEVLDGIGSETRPDLPVDRLPVEYGGKTVTMESGAIQGMCHV